MTTSMADAQILASSIGNDFAQIVLTGPLVLAAGAAVMAGMVSFLSPCVLPLVPGYVGYVTGLSGTSLGEKTTWKVVVGTSLFVLGFTVIFVVMGTVMSYLGVVFAQWEDIVIRILGIVVIIAGFIFMGGFGLMQRNRQIRAKPKAGLWSAPLLGGIFALGWAPCVGPTLSAVLSLSYSFGGEGVIWRGAFLAFAYCLGLGVPFILLALALHKGAGRLRWFRRYQNLVVKIGGIVLILLGAVMASGLWTLWLNSLQGSVAGFDIVI